MFETLFKWLCYNYCNCFYYNDEYADIKKNSDLMENDELENNQSLLTIHEFKKKLDKKIEIIDNFM